MSRYMKLCLYVVHVENTFIQWMKLVTTLSSTTMGKHHTVFKKYRQVLSTTMLSPSRFGWWIRRPMMSRSSPAIGAAAGPRSKHIMKEERQFYWPFFFAFREVIHMVFPYCHRQFYRNRKIKNQKLLSHLMRKR